MPDRIDPELVNREEWLSRHHGHSVTELEILHGVLNNPEMANHAFLYFRDPSYLDRLPPGSKPADFRSETDDAARKLGELKDRILRSGFPVRELPGSAGPGSPGPA